MKDDAGREGNIRDLIAVAEQPDQRPDKNHNARGVRKGNRDREHEIRNLQYTGKVAGAPAEPLEALLPQYPTTAP